MKSIFGIFSLLILGLANAFGAPTDFATALPASLIPDGFWSLVLLVFGVVAAIGGVVAGIGLMKRARN